MKYYIVFSEAGEFSDYRKINMYVSDVKEFAEKKMFEYETNQKPITDACHEFDSLMHSWDHNNPYPSKGYTNYAALKNSYLQEIKEKLGFKFNIDSSCVNRWADIPSYEIEEIEGD